MSLAFIQPPNSFYRLRFRDIEGEVVNMNRYQGKKLLILTVPARESDTALLNQLSAFAARYRDSIAVIGVLSVEDGYRETDKAKIKMLYKEKRKLNVLLTEGMHTRKYPDSTQGGLVRWLTDRTLNGHFDREVKGVGHKFFVDEGGDLYAVLGPEAALTHRMVERIVSKPRRVKPVPQPRKPGHP